MFEHMLLIIRMLNLLHFHNTFFIQNFYCVKPQIVFAAD